MYVCEVCQEWLRAFSLLFVCAVNESENCCLIHIYVCVCVYLEKRFRCPTSSSHSYVCVCVGVGVEICAGCADGSATGGRRQVAETKATKFTADKTFDKTLEKAPQRQVYHWIQNPNKQNRQHQMKKNLSQP